MCPVTFTLRHHRMLHRHAVPTLFYLTHDEHALPVFSLYCSGASSSMQTVRYALRQARMVVHVLGALVWRRNHHSLLPLSITEHAPAF